MIGLVIMAATLALPLPKTGQCPPGYSSEARYCVPLEKAPLAIPKVGQCPSGYASGAHYCYKIPSIIERGR